PVLHSAAAHLALPSFPTRRSSDLCTRGTASCAPSCRFSCRDGSSCSAGAANACTDGQTDNYALTAFNLWTQSTYCPDSWRGDSRSEEHTSELQLLRHLVCRLLLEK